MYYYLEDVVPNIPEMKGFRLLKAPNLLVRICEKLEIHGFNVNDEDFLIEEDIVVP